MKKLLLIQFRTGESEQHEQRCFQRVAEEDAEFEINPINSLNPEVDWNNPQAILDEYDGVVLGGSGEFHFTGNSLSEKEAQFEQAIKNVTPLSKHLLKEDFPTLGICLGHQMLGYFLGTKTELDPSQAKAGSHTVLLLEEGKKDKVFMDIPESFTAQYGHSGSLASLPKDSVLLANGTSCHNSAFRHKNNIYGVQFHPELNTEDMKMKMRLSPEYLKDVTPEEFDKGVIESPEATKVIGNFARNLS